MSENILLLIGKSGSGKTTIANYLENNFGFKQLQSYTTRPRRYDGEKGHTFITEEEYQALPDKVATTTFNGYHYCCTQSQIDNADVYVVDPHGYDELKENYHGTRKLYPVYLDIDLDLALTRMRERGDDEDVIWSRLRHDEETFRNCEKPHVISACMSIRTIAEVIIETIGR